MAKRPFSDLATAVADALKASATGTTTALGIRKSYADNALGIGIALAKGPCETLPMVASGRAVKFTAQ
jgi:hypothetical protein